MKASTTASIVLGLLSNPAMATDPVKSQIEVPVGGVTFKLSKFHDGRTTPYRLYFWDEYLTGSSYRFGKTGYLEYFKAGSEVYYDRMEKTDGSVAYKSKEASESGGRHEANDHMATMNQEAVGCDDCVDDLAVLCGYSLPMFCESTDKSYLGMSGAASVDIVCDNYKGICSILEAGCATLCDAENGHTSMCDNGFVGVQASNGACCDAGCGQCGGVGCSKFGNDIGLDKHDCCATEIVDMGKSCTEAGMAPCFIADGGDDGGDVSGDDNSNDSASMCDNGFVGVQASNGACCDAGCGQCGGPGCSEFGNDVGLDKHDCCATEIVDMGKSCPDAGKAPCFIPGGDDDLEAVIMDTEESTDEESTDEESMEAECNRSSLTAADLESLDVYDFDMYIESGCLQTTNLPNGCNFMGLGQGCRGCYSTCEGALYYIKMNESEIEEKGEDVIINFCPDSGVSSLDQCRE